jgi:hypothetical protein
MKYPKADKIKKPFTYTPSNATDVRKTIKKEQERLKEQSNKVQPLRKGQWTSMTAVGSGTNKTSY